jgi:hypothetical protein
MFYDDYLSAKNALWLFGFFVLKYQVIMRP